MTDNFYAGSLVTAKNIAGIYLAADIIKARRISVSYYGVRNGFKFIQVIYNFAV